MAGSRASPLPDRVRGGGGEMNDPFVTPGTASANPLRYSNFDSNLFALDPGSSPTQVKRALEAHLAETDRRMQEAGKLGNALVAQRKQLEERLREVEQVEAQGELAPDLRKKLFDIEKDYNEVARESARAFLPKPRIPSNELTTGSPFAPEGKGGRRSVSPSKFESQATGSPTKLSVPNRKLRNQPTNRIHDIEFAAEISTSLISQVRNLQALLSERDEELRDIKVEKSRLEAESEAFQQRVKTLDESEHRYKDENWNLETQLHELLASQKEAADREKKLNQALNALQAEKNSTQRELDEIKVSHAKLVEDHAAAVKHHDIELGTAKRNIVMADTERAAMQRKIEDLTSQNQELAKAFSMQRGRMLEREAASGLSDEDFETANDNITPEHSPPPSPVKGTPRHSMLESETLKTSLLHAQRTIQSLRTNVHREKTEKLELRRMLQDARDEIEKARSDPSSGSRPSRKTASREFKKPFRPAQLGEARISRSEIYLEDPNWEEQPGDPMSPTRPVTNFRGSRSGEMPTVVESSSDQFDTAHETSDAAFETANDERATETEDFQTGAEEMSDEATETESLSRGVGRLKRPPSLPLNQHQTRYEYQSTASTSDEEDDYTYAGSDLTKTPTSLPSRPRNRFSRSSRSGFSRSRSRQTSEEPNMLSSPANYPGSPASFATSSATGTPQAAGQSLFAELGELDGSDYESYNGATPSRRSVRSMSVRSMTPASVTRRTGSTPPVPPLPRVIMVSSGMMTEPVAIEPSSETIVEFKERPFSMNSVIRDGETSWLDSRPVSMAFSYSDAGAQHDPDMEQELARFPSPPRPTYHLGDTPIPILTPPLSLSYSSIQAENIEPLSDPEVMSPPPPTLSFSGIQTEDVEPRGEIEIPPPSFSISGITAEGIEPREELAVPPPALTMSTVLGEAIEPQAEAEIPPPALTISSVLVEAIEPQAELEIPPPALTISSVLGEDIEPQAELEVPPPVLSISTMVAEGIEPVSEPEMPPPALNWSGIQAEHIEPQSEPEIAPPVFTISSISVEHVEPLSEPEIAPATPPALVFSTITATEVEPIAEPEREYVAESRDLLALGAIAKEASEATEEPAEPASVPVTLDFSAIQTQFDLAPVDPVEPEVVVPEPQQLSFSAISGEIVEPLAEIPPVLGFSSIYGENVDPVADLEIPPPELSMSTIVTEQVEPVADVDPVLSMSTIVTEFVEPIASIQPSLSLSTIATETVEPISIPEPEKVMFSMSAIATEAVEPVGIPEPEKAIFSLSPILGEQVEPIEPPAKRLRAVAPLGYSSITTTWDTEPVSPRSPKRNGFIIPRDDERPITPIDGLFSLARGKSKVREPSTPIIAEDETRQSRSASPSAETPESQRPLKELPSNVNAKPVRKQVVPTTDQGAQTSLTSEAIDQIMALRAKASTPTSPFFSHHKTDSFGTSVGTPGTVRIRRSQESLSSVIHHKVKPVEADLDGRRPGSAASGHASIHSQNLPPLPPNHKEAIQAARVDSSQGGPGTITTMGPPLLPASAYKNQQRPRTPNGSRRPMSPASIVSVGRGTPTPKPARSGSAFGTAEVQSPTRITAHSRQSSMSSFVSEVDARFNMQNGMSVGMQEHGFGPNTDPRMIQAITQTMIGEYLWKYTRKAVGGDFSENRHRRYFWVHPYTRTLYWSDKDPSTVGRSEARVKSVPIEAVRVSTDDNPMPPGLHRKSLTILSPGRAIKFTCTTGQRHETWFNALSYLLLRTETEGQTDTESMAEHITSEDIDEFNPQYGQRAAAGTRANTPRPPPSLASFTSRTPRNETPTPYGSSYDVPTLTKTPKKNDTPQQQQQQHPQRPALGTMGRISGYWKSSHVISGTFGSLRSRSAGAVQHPRGTIYETNEVHDSAEDLRLMYEAQDRESARLENVRACCDGKHDVGTLHKRGLLASHSHSHTGASTPTASGTVKSRA
ncbi:hypothetical protein MCOR25_005451 [Pyricularia grisea]|nr:hypothetical protein MCOR25_005451 [Pyricularia grisea]